MANALEKKHAASSDLDLAGAMALLSNLDKREAVFIIRSVFMLTFEFLLKYKQVDIQGFGSIKLAVNQKNFKPYISFCRANRDLINTLRSQLDPKETQSHDSLNKTQLGRTYGHIIKQFRLSKGLTQAEWANTLGATVSVVNTWESESSCPNEYMRKKMFAMGCIFTPPQKKRYIKFLRTNSHKVFSDRLKEILKQNNWNVDDLARFLGVEKRLAYKWCEGSSLPHIEKLIKINKQLNLNFEFPTDGTWGEALRKAMYEKGYTIQQFVKEFPINHPVVTSWINERVLPNLAQMDRINELLGTNFTYEGHSRWLIPPKPAEPTPEQPTVTMPNRDKQPSATTKIKRTRSSKCDLEKPTVTPQKQMLDQEQSTVTSKQIKSRQSTPGKSKSKNQNTA